MNRAAEDCEPICSSPPDSSWCESCNSLARTEREEFMGTPTYYSWTATRPLSLPERPSPWRPLSGSPGQHQDLR
jgi:hypothetical protein